MNEQEKQQFKEMYEWFKQMQNSATIPATTDNAIRGRFFGSSPELNASSKSASSENTSVRNAAGDGSTSVLGVPDGFDERNDNGTIKYYPFFT